MSNPALDRIRDAAEEGEFNVSDVQSVCDLLEDALKALRLSKETHCKLMAHEIADMLDELLDGADDQADEEERVHDE